MKILLLAIAVLIVAIPAPSRAGAQAEANGTVGVGSTIRFRTETTGDRRVAGKVLSVDAETLLLGDTWASGTRYDRASMKDVQLKTGDHRHAGMGLFIGAMGGALVGVAVLGGDEFLDIGAGAAAIIGGLAGGLVGVAVGATIRHDEWLPVDSGDFRVGLGFDRTHGAALSLSMRF